MVWAVHALQCLARYEVAVRYAVSFFRLEAGNHQLFKKLGGGCPIVSFRYIVNRFAARPTSVEAIEFWYRDMGRCVASRGFEGPNNGRFVVSLGDVPYGAGGNLVTSFR